MSKRVLILGSHSLGVYNLRKELILELLKENYEVIVSLPHDEKVDEMIEWGCQFEETQIDRRGVNPISDAKLLFNYLKLLRKIKPDVVLTYTVKPNIYGSLACTMLKIPYINNITGLGSGFSNGTVLRVILENLYKISLRNSNCVFFQNESNLEMFKEKKIIRGTHKLIPGSGVNLEHYEFKNLDKDKELTFIYVGRVLKDKGIDQFLEAAKIIKEENDNIKFEIVGFIEETQAHYHEKISQLEKDGVIIYHGYQQDVRNFMEKAHCLILPSYSEGLSNVMLEAGALGRILISSNIPGCKEIIDENKNGYTFEVKDTESLVIQIKKVVNLDWLQREAFGMASRKKIETTFCRSIVVRNYMETINEIL